MQMRFVITSFRSQRQLSLDASEFSLSEAELRYAAGRAREKGWGGQTQKVSSLSKVSP